MRNIDWRAFRNLGFGILAILFALAVVVTFLSYSTSPPTNPLLYSAWQHHVIIMLVLVIFSVAFGFASSALSAQQVQRAQKTTKGMLDVILPFLQPDERAVLDFLVKQDGQAKQADLSRLPNMTRLRAHRSVQRLESKGIVSVTPHGKVRVISLKEGLLDVLQTGM